jgi:hypothetical protein
MDFGAFKNAVTELMDYYVKPATSRPTDDILRDWCRTVQHIPNEAVASIKQKIKSDYNNLPRNIPMAFKELWTVWKKENPSRVILGDIEPCTDCDGSGILWAKRLRENGKYPYPIRAVFLCYRCENWKRTIGPCPDMYRHTREYLEGLGWTVER